MFSLFGKARVTPCKLRGATGVIYQIANISNDCRVPAMYTISCATNTTVPVPNDVKELAHHAKQGTGFANPWESYREMSGPSILRALLTRRLKGSSNQPDTTPPTVPVRKPSFLSTRTTSKLRATWLGHACYYVEFPGGLRVLFDPVFTERCSPMSWLGPKRYTEMPCDVDDIPFIDIVVISHSHYDHLSHPTILKIQKRHPNVHFFAPLGNKPWFTSCGIENMTELDWWESQDLVFRSSDKGEPLLADSQSGVVETPSERAQTMSATIGCLPCQHTSGRTPFDKSHTLWASWSIESGGQKVWFGGDTGYRAVPELAENTDKAADYGAEYNNLPVCPAFKQIGSLRGPFDLGLIPIGAYEPRWIMSPMHANPYDSVNIFVDTKCERALGIHWGTWVLTEEDVLEPPRLLKQALAWKALPESGVFDVCDIGESREFRGAK